MNLTELEKKVLQGIVDSDFMNESIENDSIIESSIWSFSGNPGLVGIIYSGVCSSLSQKGLIGTQDNSHEKLREDRENVMWLTKEGVEELRRMK